MNGKLPRGNAANVENLEVHNPVASSASAILTPTRTPSMTGISQFGRQGLHQFRKAGAAEDERFRVIILHGAPGGLDHHRTYGRRLVSSALTAMSTACTLQR